MLNQFCMRAQSSRTRLRCCPMWRSGAAAGARLGTCTAPVSLAPAVHAASPTWKRSKRVQRRQPAVHTRAPPSLLPCCRPADKLGFARSALQVRLYVSLFVACLL